MDVDPELRPIGGGDRLRRGLIVVALAALFGYLAWIVRRGEAADDGRAATLCAVLYQRAHSAADTALVYGLRPVMSGEYAAAPRSCGELRRAAPP
jgi:hypothetical protein